MPPLFALGIHCAICACASDGESPVRVLKGVMPARRWFHRMRKSRLVRSWVPRFSPNFPVHRLHTMSPTVACSRRLGFDQAASSAPFVATFASIPFSSQAICHDGSCIGGTGDVHVVHADRTQRELRQSMSNGDERQQHTFPTEHCIHLQDFETSNHGMLVVPADRWRISRRAARSTGGQAAGYSEQTGFPS